MAFTFAVADSYSATGWLDDDGTFQVDLLDDGGVGNETVDDDDTGTGTGFKVGKSPHDITHLVFNGAAGGLTTSDTVTLWLSQTHQLDNGIDLIPYTDANSVSATAGDRINIASPVSGANVFTLTSAFIAAVYHDGTGYHMRCAPNGDQGDGNQAEYDFSLTEGGGGGIPIVVAEHHHRMMRV